MNRYRMLFVQTSTRPANMHLKLTKHGMFCKQNNQLPTKSHDVLEDNSISTQMLVDEVCMRCSPQHGGGETIQML